LPSRCSNPLPTSYHPELDISPELNADDANYFQSVIGILRWAVERPTYFFGDNMSVIMNISIPESVLKKKSNSIAYHCVREAVAMGESFPPM
jgi:hypothetical protein